MRILEWPFTPPLAVYGGGTVTLDAAPSTVLIHEVYHFHKLSADLPFRPSCPRHHQDDHTIGIQKDWGKTGQGAVNRFPPGTAQLSFTKRPLIVFPPD
jgi:hypothetical protein